MSKKKAPGPGRPGSQKAVESDNRQSTSTASRAVPAPAPSLSDAAPAANAISPLPREEYIEQTHLFTLLGDRLRDNIPAQEILGMAREEILATTKLPMAVDFMAAELRHLGAFASAMERLKHYFTPFQCFVMREAENDRGRFDLRIGLEILAREAKYRSEDATRQGLFLFQFEVLCRNRLGYDSGLDAVAGDPAYDEAWRQWILTVRRQIGIIELADLIYVRSEFYHDRQGARLTASDGSDVRSEQAASSVAAAIASGAPPLFGRQEGRICWANRQKDPLLLFAALHRQLGYPRAPRPRAEDPEERLLPVLARRVEQLEARLKLVEEEQRGGIQLEKLYVANQAKLARDDS